LILYRPKLFHADAVEMPSMLLISRGVGVHTLIDMIVDMEGIDYEMYARYLILKIGNVLRVAGFYVHRIRACGIVSDHDGEILDTTGTKSMRKAVVRVGEARW
jgi:hypothetical protein